MKNRAILIFLIFLLIVVSIIHLYAQENNRNGKNENNDIIKQINKNYDEVDKGKENKESTGNIGNSINTILFRTFFVSFILLLIFIVIKMFFAKYRKISATGTLAKIIYEEYFYKNYKIGIMESLGHYFLISFTPKINIMYEFTKKEDIDNILLLKSKQDKEKKGFRDFLKGVGIIERQSVTNNDFLKNLKQKINNISRSQDE